MLRANLNGNNSLSSAIGSLLFDATGVKEIVRDSVVAPALRDALAEKYKRKVDKVAREDDLWNPLSGTFNVQIPNNQTVVITSGSSSEDSRMAEALEFGTPENPARPIIRPYQEVFKQDLMFNINDINKSIDL